MRLLVCLAERAGEVVSIEDLLNQVWSEVIVSPDSVYQAVASLRRVLGDDPKQPTYIETVPRLGYRMVATVSPWVGVQSSEQPDSLYRSRCDRCADTRPASQSRLDVGHLGRRCDAVGLALVVAFLLYGRSRITIPQPQPPLLHCRRNPSPCCRFST